MQHPTTTVSLKSQQFQMVFQYVQQQSQYHIQRLDTFTTFPRDSSVTFEPSLRPPRVRPRPSEKAESSRWVFYSHHGLSHTRKGLKMGPRHPSFLYQTVSNPHGRTGACISFHSMHGALRSQKAPQRLQKSAALEAKLQ